MDPLRQLTVLSLEQATVLPYLTFRLVQDGVQVIRLEHPVFGDPNRMVGDNVLEEERMYQLFYGHQCRQKGLDPEPGRTGGAADLKGPDCETKGRYLCHQPTSPELCQAGHRL